jgi:hypothetical protein
MESNRSERRGLTRRQMLKYTGMAGAFSGFTGRIAGFPVKSAVTPVSHPFLPGPTPVSLIIDDGSPVDPLFYEIPGYETPFLVPHEFTRRVIDTFNRFDLRGKFTLIPMPSCLGRIDQSLKRVSGEHLEEFLKLVREGIAPRFDITPEFLTHLNAYNLKSGKFMHIYEDVWISQASPDEIVEYFTLAFRILKNAGIEANGITSPWVSGIDVEKKYAKALGDAQWNLFNRRLTWYFLNAASDSENPFPMSVQYKNDERGQTVVSLPSNAGDIFWTMDEPDREKRKTMIKDGIDRLVSPDGKTGRIRQLIDTGFPVVIVTHWQSLYTQGTGLGLEGLASLAERMRKVFGQTIEWVSCYEMARRFASAKA